MPLLMSNSELMKRKRQLLDQYAPQPEYDPDIPEELPHRVQPKQGYAPFGGLKTLAGSLVRAPLQVVKSGIQAFQGQSGASVADRDIGDVIVDKINRWEQERQEKIREQYGEQKFLPGISVSDVGELAQNIGFSGASLGAGAAGAAGGALAGTLAGGPIGTGAGALAGGTGASGAAAYRMSGYDIMQRFLEAKDQEKRDAIGIGLTKEEEEQLKNDFSSKASQYGLWEAIPEAVGNLGMVAGLGTALSKVAGKHTAGRVLAGLGLMYGPELATETVTQMGQQRTLADTPISEGEAPQWTSAGDWYRALKDVAPQTLLLTSVMGGAGAVGSKAFNSYWQSRPETKATVFSNGIQEATQADVLKDMPEEELTANIQAADNIINSLQRKKGDKTRPFQNVIAARDTLIEEQTRRTQPPEVVEPVQPVDAKSQLTSLVQSGQVQPNNIDYEYWQNQGLTRSDIDSAVIDTLGAPETFEQETGFVSGRRRLIQRGEQTPAIPPMMQDERGVPIIEPGRLEQARSIDETLPRGPDTAYGQERLIERADQIPAELDPQLEGRGIPTFDPNRETVPIESLGPEYLEGGGRVAPISTTPGGIEGQQQETTVEPEPQQPLKLSRARLNTTADTGTAKQQKWSKSIKREKADELENLATNGQITQQELNTAYDVFNNTDSRFWIDNRGSSVIDIIRMEQPQEEPEQVEQRPVRIASSSEGALYVDSPYEYKDTIKKIPGAKWMPEARTWLIPEESLQDALSLIPEAELSDEYTRKLAAGEEQPRPTPMFMRYSAEQLAEFEDSAQFLPEQQTESQPEPLSLSVEGEIIEDTPEYQRVKTPNGFIVRIDKASGEQVQEAQEEQPYTLDSHKTFMNRLNKGDITAEELKAEYQRFKDNRDVIKAELKKLTVKQLRSRINSFIHPGLKKAQLVEHALDDIATDFIRPRGSSVSWSPMSEDYTAAVDRTIDTVTDDQIKGYSQKRQAQVETYKKSLTNPETIEEFEKFIMLRGKERLTPEQQATYDDLKAQQSRERRQEQPRQPEQVTQPTEGATLQETVHEKKNKPVFVVQLGERVDKETYSKILKEAKKNGGWYSKFSRGRAIPGFQFFNKAKAEEFLSYVKGEQSDKRQEQPKLVERIKPRDWFHLGDIVSQEYVWMDKKSESSVLKPRRDILKKVADSLGISTADTERALAVYQSEKPKLQARQFKDNPIPTEINKPLYERNTQQPKGLDAKTAKAIERMRETARKTREKAQEALNADRKMNTPKRVREGNRAIEGANYEVYIADTMDKIADAIESGKATHLNGVTNKIAVGEIDAQRRAAFRERSKAEGWTYSQQEEKSPTIEDVQHAKYPMPWLRDFPVQSMFDALDKTTAGQKVARKLDNIIRNATGRRIYGVLRNDALSAEDLTFNNDKNIQDFLEALSGMSRNKSTAVRDVYKKWGSQVKEYFDSYNRLQRMDIKNETELKAALREFYEMRAPKKEIDAITKAEQAMIGRKIEGYFPTPKPIAERMVEELDLQPGQKVLEPSAGKGNLADAVKESGVEVDTEVIEPFTDLRNILEAKGYKLVGYNFLEHQGEYDRIIMNPPFEQGKDMTHVMRAYEMLKPGGKLVAIMGEGGFFREDKQSKEFRKWLDDVGGTSEKLPEGSFKSAERPTGVNTRMVVIEKQLIDTKSDVQPRTDFIKKLPSFFKNSLIFKDKNNEREAVSFVRKHTKEASVNELRKLRDEVSGLDNANRRFIVDALDNEISNRLGDEYNNTWEALDDAVSPQGRYSISEVRSILKPLDTETLKDIQDAYINVPRRDDRRKPLINEIQKELDARNVVIEKGEEVQPSAAPSFVELKSVQTPAGAISAEGAKKIFIRQGDPTHIGFDATVRIEGKEPSQEAKDKYARVLAAKEQGYKWRNYRAGSYGTVWVLEKDGKVLTKKGFERINDKTYLRPDTKNLRDKTVVEVPWAPRMNAYAEALTRAIDTLPNGRESAPSVITKFIRETPLGDWVKIDDRSYGSSGYEYRVAFLDKDGNHDLYEYASNATDLYRLIFDIADMGHQQALSYKNRQNVLKGLPREAKQPQPTEGRTQTVDSLISRFESLINEDGVITEGMDYIRPNIIEEATDEQLIDAKKEIRFHPNKQIAGGIADYVEMELKRRGIDTNEKFESANTEVWPSKAQQFVDSLEKMINEKSSGEKLESYMNGQYKDADINTLREIIDLSELKFQDGDQRWLEVINMTDEYLISKEGGRERTDQIEPYGNAPASTRVMNPNEEIDLKRGEKEYLIATGKGNIRVAGKPIKLDIAPNHEFFVHNVRGVWKVTESSTGFNVFNGRTIKEAKAGAEQIIKDMADAQEGPTGEEYLSTTLKRLPPIGKPIKYSIAPTAPLSVLTKADVQSLPGFAKHTVTENEDGSFTVTPKRGNTFTINMVSAITPNNVSLSIGYGNQAEGAQVAGAYHDNHIEIVKDIGGKWTISHEYAHHLENLGVINAQDKAVINATMKRKGSWDKELSPEENRANWIADNLQKRQEQKGFLRRILRKVGDFIDSLANMVATTARGTLRKIETGEIEGTAQTTEPQYSIFNRKVDTRPDDIKALIGRGEEKTIRETITDAMDNLKRNWKTRIFDRLEPVRKIGQPIYEQMRIETGTEATVDANLQHGKLEWDASGLPIVKTKDQGVLPWAEEIGWDDFLKTLHWVAARRAHDLEKQGREQWLTPSERRKIFKWVGARPDKGGSWKQLARKLRDYNKNILDFAEQAGLFTKKDRAMWESDFYVPFYRILEDPETREEFLKAPGLSRKHISSGIKTLIGSKNKIGDLAENMMKNWVHLIGESIRNKNRADAVRLGMNLHTQDASGNLIPIFERVSGKNIRVVQQPDKTIMYISPDNSTNIMSFRGRGDDGRGKQFFYKVHDPELYNALTNMNATKFDSFLSKIFGTSKRWLTYGATFGPAFKAANMMRDSLQTAIISKSYNPFMDAFRGAMKVWKEDEDYIRYASSGAAHGGNYIKTGDPQSIAKKIESITNREGKGALDRILDTPKKMLDFWEKVGRASEEAARVMTYTHRIQEGKTHREAAFEARDLLDFYRRGDAQIVQHLIHILPFANARMQGLYKLGEAYKADKKSFLVKGSALALASLALWGLNKDKPEYKDLEDWEKRTYYHFWIGDKHYRIPKPFEVGAIFSSLFETAADTMTGREDFDYFKDFVWNTIVETFAMNPFPQAVRPLAEQWANKSFFTGRPIVGMSLDRLKPEEQYEPWTSETTRVIGDKLGISPKRIESMIRGYFSTVGMFLLGATDILTRNIGDFPEQPSKQIQDYPLLGRFVRDNPTRHTKAMTKFYETMRDLDEVNATLNYYIRTGDMEKAKELAQKEGSKLEFKTEYNRARRTLSDISKEIKLTYLNREMSPKEKRERINELTIERARVAKSVPEVA